MRGISTVQGDANLTTTFHLEVVSVSFHGRSVSDQDIVSRNPRFTATISYLAFTPVTRASWCEVAGVVAQDGTAPRLVKGDPVLDFRSHSLEDKTCVVSKVRHEFYFVEESTVPVFEVVREVPVE